MAHAPAKELPVFRFPYQRGQSMSRGRLMFWLVLAVEAFFFLSLIGICLGFRFASSSAVWPSSDDVGVDSSLGVLVTGVLIGSNVALWRCWVTAKKDEIRNAKGWLASAALLGAAFLALKVDELRNKALQNLLPPASRDSIFEQVDASYVSAVTIRLSQLKTAYYADDARQAYLSAYLAELPEALAELQSAVRAIESEIETLRAEADASHSLELVASERRLAARKVELQNFDYASNPMRAELANLVAAQAERSERRNVVETLLDAGASWTGRVVGRAADADTQYAAMVAFAQDVYPLTDFSEIAQRYWQEEYENLASELQILKQDVASRESLVNAELAELNKLQAAKQGLLEEQRKLAGAEDADLEADTAENLAGIAQQLGDNEQRILAVATSVTNAQQEIMEASNRIGDCQVRRNYCDSRAAVVGGLNGQYPWMHLPVCVPGARLWSSVFFLLTSVHAIHIMIGLVGMLLLMRSGLGDKGLDRLGCLGLYWHFVGIVWLVQFPFLYLV